MKNFIRDFFNGCGHCVFGVDCADDCGPAFITAFVFYANALDIRNNDEILPYFFSKTVVCKFFAENCVCFTKSCKTVTGDCAKAANTKAGTRERLAVNHSVRKTKSFADYAYFVFEEKFDRFNKFEVKVFGKAADVVVALNCFFAFCGFDHSVANMLYFYFFGEISWHVVGYILCSIAGNIVGGVLLPLVILLKEHAKNLAEKNGFLDRFRGLLKVGMYSQELAEYPIDFTPDELQQLKGALCDLWLEPIKQKVGHIINVFSFVMCPIFFENPAWQMPKLRVCA